jgi:hypothetical protein
VAVNQLGTSLLGTAAFSPSGIGVAVSPAIFYFANTSTSPILPAFTLQNGSTGPITVTNNCSGYISVSGSYPAISLTPVLTTAAVSGGAPELVAYPGTCQIIFTDSASHQTAINAIVGQ